MKKMADDTASSSRSVSSDSREKDAKRRGPYNQYLSQPNAKIPRTTLKKWPERNCATTSISPTGNSADDLPTTSNDSLSDFHSSTDIVTDYMETVGSELSLSSLNQTDNSSEKSLSEYETHDDEDDQSFESPSNQCEPPEDDIFHEETSAPSESEQTRIGAFEDELYDNCVDEYMAAFYSDENTSHTNGHNFTEEPEENMFADTPLYKGAPISVAVSMLLVVTFAIRHSLTGLAILDLLTLVSLHCAVPNECASSMDLLKKFFMKLKNPIQFHYYCTFCMEYQGLSIPDDKLCKNKCCLKDLSKKENSSYFLIIPLMCQLRDLMQSKWSLTLS